MDGYLDSASDDRLSLSNEADFDRVDAVRASCDAILVGASTVRKDNPRLNVRDPARIAMRMASGQSPTPVKVTVTSRGDLDPKARFFTTGDCEKLVYCTYEAFPATRRRLGHQHDGRRWWRGGRDLGNLHAALQRLARQRRGG